MEPGPGSVMRDELVAHSPAGAVPRPAQVRLLDELGAAIGDDWGDGETPRVFVVEAPPGVGKGHLALTLARWSGDAFLLTSQKLLQDQYEREFGDALQLVKGRENYLCERYPPPARMPTSQGLCRRPRGPACQCPYARAKVAALNGPIFCTNTAYFLTLRQWQREHLRRRRRDGVGGAPPGSRSHRDARARAPHRERHRARALVGRGRRRRPLLRVHGPPRGHRRLLRAAAGGRPRAGERVTLPRGAAAHRVPAGRD